MNLLFKNQYSITILFMLIFTLLMLSVVFVDHAAAHHRSTDSSLRKLDVNVATSPAFVPSTLRYSASVPKSLTEVTVSAVPNHSGANVYYGPTDVDPDTTGHQYNLSKGQNEFYINVLAEDSNYTTEYRLSVWRNPEGVEPSLSSLSIGRDMHPTFAPATRDYVSYVWHGVDELTVTATLTDTNGSMVYSTPDADDSTDGHQYSLDVGRNDFHIDVYAEDPRDDNRYTITVWRHPDVPALVENRHGQLGAQQMHSGNWHQFFTTGPSSLGYTVNSVRLSISGPSEDKLEKLNIIDRETRESVGEFFLPHSDSSAEWDIFYAVEPFHLKPNHRYSLHIDRPSEGDWLFRVHGVSGKGAHGKSYYGWNVHDRVCGDMNCNTVSVRPTMLLFRIQGTPVDQTPPQVIRAESKARAIFLTFDERLDDDDRIPAKSSFSVTDSNGSSLDIHKVYVKGRQVRVLTEDVIDFDDTVKVSYSPGSGFIRDFAHNDLAAFSDLSVQTVLTTIEVDGEQVSFPDSQWRYQVTVPNSSEWVTISASSRNPDNYLLMRITHADRGGEGSISGRHKLEPGLNRIVIRVWERCCPLPEYEDPMVHILHITRSP